MPISFELDARTGLTRSMFTGPIVAEELADHCRRLRDAGAHRRPGLVDVREMDSELGMTDLLRLARVLSSELAECRVARRAVVVRGRRHFEWARTMATLVAGWLSVGVFTDLHEAELWLLHAERSAPAPARARAGTA